MEYQINEIPFSDKKLQYDSIVNNDNIKLSDCEVNNYDDFFNAEDIESELSSCALLENYSKRDLLLIAGYYGIRARKLSKARLIEEILIYEQNPDNGARTARRQMCWEALEILLNDPYMKKIILY